MYAKFDLDLFKIFEQLNKRWSHTLKVLRTISLIHFHVNYDLELHMSLIGNHQHSSIKEINLAQQMLKLLK